MAASKVQTKWEEWQRGYIHGAFYIFPPASVSRTVDELRSRYDGRSAKYSSAHVSLSRPLVAPLRASQRLEIEEALAIIEPFDVHYGPLRDFDPHPGVAFAITPEDSVETLRAAIHATSAFRGHDLSKKPIAPHMTIAEFITLEQSKVLLTQLSDNVAVGSFRCDEVVYAMPDEAFRFHAVLSIVLGGGR